MRLDSCAKVLTGFSLICFQLPLLAQNVSFTINTQIDRKPISPYIYGYNAYSDGSNRPGWENQGGQAALLALNPTSRRLGGNNMTSYNWENGVSNSGADWCDSSNAGVSVTSGAGEPNYNNGLAYYAPGAALLKFQEQSLVLGTYSLLQLPAAGKLPKNIVNLNPPSTCRGYQLWQDAPGRSDIDTSRWLSIVNDKPDSAGGLSTNPSLSDGVVYIDEQINFLNQNFGKANTTRGIKGYELDNEPDLWHLWPQATGEAGTHTKLYPTISTVGDVLQKNIALAKTIKRVDSSAETFGPAVSGYLGLFSLWSVWDGQQGHQPADWSQYNKEPFVTNNSGDSYRYNRMTMANVYLAKMKEVSALAGRRLLDVFSFHYYPQASYQASDRVQAPRSLWDASYVEPSWITQPGYGFTDGRGLQVIPKLKQAIQDFYPDTKLAITEYDFGGRDEISGAIAQADALGIFGQQGIYLATYFGDAENFIAAGFKIYRNYDGNKSVFPEIAVKASSTNVNYASVYAAVSATKPDEVHVIAINRQAVAVKASLQLQHPVALKKAAIWGVTNASSTISKRNSVSLSNNKLSYSLPASSVLHFVITP